MFAPNRRTRSPNQQLDARTANALANKERELMQTTHSIDYYKDGLGSRAPLNSDDLNEKCARYVQTGHVDNQMVNF